MNEAQIDNSLVISRREVSTSITDEAWGFCDGVQSPGLPLEFKQWVVSLMKDWNLLEEDPEDLSDEAYLKMLATIKASIKDGNLQVTALPGLREIHEVPYSEEEKDSLPLIVQLGKKLQENLTVKVYFESISFTILVIRENGKRQVLRITAPQRSLTEISQDLRSRPPILPPFEIVEMEDGKIAVLIDWIEGKNPESDEERAKCLTAAEPLKQLKIEGNKTGNDWVQNLDLNNSNFKITEEGEVFAIDRHLILGFINYGFKPSIS